MVLLYGARTVQSPNVGNINTIELVDESGNVIPNQTVTSNNSGPGNSPLQMGDVVEIALPLPQGVNLTQNMKVQTSYQTLDSSTLSSIAAKLDLKNIAPKATSNETIGNVIYPIVTQESNINLQLTPSLMYLTRGEYTQEGYLYNIGDLTASDIKISTNNPNIVVTTSDEIVNEQRAIKITYSLLDKEASSETYQVTISAQNPSGETQTTTGSISQNVNPNV